MIVPNANRGGGGGGETINNQIQLPGWCVFFISVPYIANNIIEYYRLHAGALVYMY